MTSRQIDIPLIAPVQWDQLQSQIDEKLQQLLNLKDPSKSFKGGATVVEPWRFWLWSQTPEGHSSWDPIPWFSGGIDDEAFATSQVTNQVIGFVSLTLQLLPLNNRDEMLFVTVTPGTQPVEPNDLVFTLAVAAAISDNSESFLHNDYGLCGPYSRMTWQQMMNITSCRGAHSTVEEAMNEVIDNWRRSYLKKGKQPPH